MTFSAPIMSGGSSRHLTLAFLFVPAAKRYLAKRMYNGQTHDYLPDFFVRLKSDSRAHLIPETKGFDPLAEVMKAAAVHAEGRFGRWRYGMARKIEDIPGIITRATQI